jgi:hypothetical protein
LGNEKKLELRPLEIVEYNINFLSLVAPTIGNILIDIGTYSIAAHMPSVLAFVPAGSYELGF